MESRGHQVVARAVRTPWLRGEGLRENEERLTKDRLDGSGFHVALRRQRLERSTRFRLAKAEGPQTTGGGLEGRCRRRRALVTSQVHPARDVRAAEDLPGVQCIVRSAPHAQIDCSLRAAECLRVDVIQLEVSAREAAIAVRADLGAPHAVSREDRATAAVKNSALSLSAPGRGTNRLLYASALSLPAPQRREDDAPRASRRRTRYLRTGARWARSRVPRESSPHERTRRRTKRTPAGALPRR